MSSYVAVAGVPSGDTCSIFGLTPQEIRYLQVSILKVCQQKVLHSILTKKIYSELCFEQMWKVFNKFEFIQIPLRKHF